MTMTEVTAVTLSEVLDQDDKMAELYEECFRLQNENDRLRSHLRFLLDR
ncbi:MAG: hypothetical protein JF603_10770 [Acidobacteria bacterium]|nr:hypothetical protein [Acidobacteriota bacterium]